MEKKVIEVKNYKTVYVAADGTEFDDEMECTSYDKSALGVIRGRISKLAVFHGDEEDLFGCGSCDNELMIVVPKTVDDIYLIRQLIVLRRGSSGYADGLGEDQVGKPVILFFGYEDDGCWYKTLEGIVSDATNGTFTLAPADKK